jgi:KUP system potassium uptake protein
MDTPDIPAELGDAVRKAQLAIDLTDATYYLGRETFLRSPKGQLGPISEDLFSFLSRNAAGAMSYFAIPPAQVVELGTQIDL